jgi:hypothetical protein
MSNIYFQEGKKYKTAKPIKVCTETADGHDCEMAEMVDLTSVTTITFVDLVEDTFRFSDDAGTIYRLHGADIDDIEPA